MFNASLNRLLTAVVVCSLLFQSCQSGMRAITEEDPELKQGCLMPADHLQDAGEALSSGALAPVRADARVSGAFPSELVSAVVPASPPFLAGPFTASSGERVLLRQQQGQWQAVLQGGVGAVVHGRTLPVVGAGDIGRLLSSLQGQDVWSSRSRLHVLAAPHMPSTPCVYVGKLGLLGGAPKSQAQAPVGRELVLHIGSSGEEGVAAYQIPSGCRYKGYRVKEEVLENVAVFKKFYVEANNEEEVRTLEAYKQGRFVEGKVGADLNLPFGYTVNVGNVEAGAGNAFVRGRESTHMQRNTHAALVVYGRTRKKSKNLFSRQVRSLIRVVLEVFFEEDTALPPSPISAHNSVQSNTYTQHSHTQGNSFHPSMSPPSMSPPLISPEVRASQDQLRRDKEAAEAQAALEEKRLADDQARLIGEKKAAEEQARLAEAELAEERIRLAKGQKIAAERLRLAKEKEAADERARLAREELEKLRTESLLSQTTLPSQAFGAKAWSQYFGEVGVEPSLPADINTTLSGACPFWPGKQVKDTHLLVLIPAKVNGKPYSLNLLSELIQHPKGGGHATQYRTYGDLLKEAYGTQSPGRSYWVLMTREVLEGSRSKTYADQKALVSGHAKRTQLPYELPGALEAATAMLSHYVRSGERLYTDSPCTYTRCREFQKGNFFWTDSAGKKHPFDIWYAVVGGFSSGGLDVGYDCHDSHDSGVAGFRKF